MVTLVEGATNTSPFTLLRLEGNKIGRSSLKLSLFHLFRLSFLFGLNFAILALHRLLKCKQFSFKFFQLIFIWLVSELMK